MLPRIPRKYSTKDILDTLPKFKAWIETTKLFNVLVEETNPETRFFKSPGLLGVLPSLISPEISMNLSGVVVKTPYDLPIELIGQFYMNSPFFTGRDLAVDTEEFYSPQKQIDNGKE